MVFRQLIFTIIIDSRSIISIFQDTRRLLPMSRCFTSVLKFGFFFVLLITELWGNFNLRLRTFMLQDIFLLVQFPKSHHKSESEARFEVQTLTFTLTFSPCISASIKVPIIICHLHILSTSTKCGGYLYDVTAAFHVNPEIEITSNKEEHNHN